MIAFKSLLVTFLIVSLSLTTLFAQKHESQLKKLSQLLQNIEEHYTDSIMTDALYEEAMSLILKELDPHSKYFNTAQTEDINRRLDATFDGIGITYNMIRDTLYIQSVVPNGPAEKAGVRRGDRVIEVDNETIAGVKMNSEGIHKRIGGKRGSEVLLTIKRRDEKKFYEILVTRDKIQIESVEAAYMARPGVGYIKLSKFSSNSDKDIEDALKTLKTAGAEHIILDLRGNTGGYLNSAVKISEEFLDAGKLIVYTEGENSDRTDYSSHGRGLYTDGRVAVLVDSQSASASEIVSGALQDWDRAVIIGQKTYGKGLVQRPFYFDDGSMMRLTIARYYTPTGRSIQKSYDVNNKIVSKDSIESIEYKTLTNKRIVTSGGGILPDVLTETDSLKYPKIYKQWMKKNTISEFVHDYTDENRENLTNIYPDFEKYQAEFQIDIEFLQNLTRFAEGKNVENFDVVWKELLLNPNVAVHLKALIAGDLWTEGEYIKVVNENSPEFLKAIEYLTEKESYEKILAEKY